MARLDRDSDAPGPIVRGFAAGGFVVDGQVYRALQMTPTSAAEWNEPPPVEALAAGDFEALLEIDPRAEFLLLGTGPRLSHPPRALREALGERGIGLEVMDSRAAARAWGLLRGEERWIAAALMPL